MEETTQTLAGNQNVNASSQKGPTSVISVDLRDGRGWKTRLDQSSKVCAYMRTKFFARIRTEFPNSIGINVFHLYCWRNLEEDCWGLHHNPHSNSRWNRFGQSRRS